MYDEVENRRMNTKLNNLLRTACVGVGIGLAAPAAAAATANDPMLPQQWALADPAAIGAPEAWTQSMGTGVLVAVLDTGVQLDHPDLAGAIWTNPGEVAGNGRDDDSNGFVDDVHGANMFDSSANVDDDNGHGTHVSGVIAARQGNGIGVSGIAPEATILPVKVLDANMAGTTDTLARGIRYAVDKGAKILNISVNTDVATAPIQGAVKYAGEHGAVVVASAGNNGRNIDLLPSYVASLSDPAVLTVGALSSAGKLWAQSNTGLLSVDLAAPGVQIVGTARGSAYQSRTGTSAAAPMVAGTIALLAAAREDLPMSALKAIVLETTRRDDLLATLLGGGRLDTGAAMHRALEGRPWKTAPADDASAATAATLRLSTKSTIRPGTKAALRWTATGADTVTRWRVSLDRKVVATLSADRAKVQRRCARPGSHRWRVVGLDAAGAKVVSAQRSFKVARAR
jgi:subtilisin family serine protease